MVSSPARRPRPSHRRGDIRRRDSYRRDIRLVRVAAAAVMVAAVASCTPGTAGLDADPRPDRQASSGQAAPSEAASAPQGPAASSAPAASQNPASAGEPASASASASAELTTVKRAVGSAMREAAAAEGEPTRQLLRTALQAAGFAPNTVEIAAGRTPTGLIPDVFQAAVHHEGRCVMAQLRDTKVSVSVLDTLPNGHCFVGDDRGTKAPDGEAS